MSLETIRKDPLEDAAHLDPDLSIRRDPPDTPVPSTDEPNTAEAESDTTEATSDPTETPSESDSPESPSESDSSITDESDASDSDQAANESDCETADCETTVSEPALLSGSGFSVSLDSIIPDADEMPILSPPEQPADAVTTHDTKSDVCPPSPENHGGYLEAREGTESTCDCGHDHHDHHDHHSSQSTPSNRELNQNACGERRVYTLKNLSCAHCAAQMEEKIRRLPGISDAVVVYATRQLRIAADNPDARLEQIRRACAAIEPGVQVEPLEDKHRTVTPEPDSHELHSLVIGAVLLGIGLICERFQPMVAMFVLCLSYVILGGEVLLTAIKNIKNGHVFDENFLMSLATLGAIAMGTYDEAVGVMLFYRVGEFFEHRAVEKSRKQIMEAVDLRPQVVHRIDAYGVVHTIAAASANVGDLLLVRPGDRIPLDGIVRAGDSRIDTSPVTGEPIPVSVHPSSDVISGCVNGTGALQIEVTHTLADSMVTRILNAVENAAASKPKMDRFVTRFSRIYTPIVVLASIATAIIPSVITGDWMHWTYTALSFLVISCPCALVLSVPLSFFAGIGAGSKRGILFKGGAALEALRNVRTVAMDKTGTLTKGNFVLQQISTVDGMTDSALLAMAASCETQSTHPIAQSILAAAQERKVHVIAPSKLQEIPGQGIVAMISGVPVLCGNRRLLETAGIDLSKHTASTVGTEVLVAASGHFAGSLLISDTIKPTAKIAMKQLRKLDLTTVMLTGDAQESAEAVATHLDIQEVRAHLLPEQKLSALQDIRSRHGAVMYVGDGINDAPVLANAEVGAAMGSGADAAIEAADVVFMTSDPLAIGDSVEIARIATRVAWQNVVFALAVKIAVMGLGIAGIASMWLAVFADSGVAMLCVLNAIRILYKK